MGAIFSNFTMFSYQKLAIVDRSYQRLIDPALTVHVTQGDFSNAARHLPKAFGETFLAIAKTSFFSGFHTLLWVALGISLVGALLSYTLIP